MDGIHATLLGVRFVLELCAVCALGYWGLQTGQNGLMKILLGLGAPLLAAIVVLAKGLASGYPISAVLFREELSTWTPAAHGTTFGGNAVSVAAALATLDLLEEGLMDNARRVSEHLMRGLLELQKKHPRLGDVRGRGLMIGLDFVKDRETRNEDPALRDQVQQKAFEKGLLVLSAGPSTVRLAPPLILTLEEADIALDVLGEVLRAVGA